MCKWLIGDILKNDSSLSCMNLIKALSTRCGYFWKWSFFLRFKTNAETMKIRYRSYPLLSILDVWYHLIREPAAFSCIHRHENDKPAFIVSENAVYVYTKCQTGGKKSHNHKDDIWFLAGQYIYNSIFALVFQSYHRPFDTLGMCVRIADLC